MQCNKNERRRRKSNYLVKKGRKKAGVYKLKRVERYSRKMQARFKGKA